MARFFIPGRRIESGSAALPSAIKPSPVGKGTVRLTGGSIPNLSVKVPGVDRLLGTLDVTATIPPSVPSTAPYEQTIPLSEQPTPPSPPSNGDGNERQPDGYVARIVKYIPGENVGVFVFIRGLFPPNAGKTQWILFFVSLALVPAYMTLAARSANKSALLSQVVIATLAFVIWVIAIGGPPFQNLTFYKPQWAEVILAVATVLMGA